MAVYNGAAYLAEAVESVLQQTFADFELVIVDDGSTDATGEMLFRLSAADSRIRVCTRKHEGYVAALNAGCALARGDLIARLDSDDLAEPSRFARQVEVMDGHPNVAVVGGAMLMITADGRPFYIAAFPQTSEEVRRALESRTAVAHPTVLMRRSVFESVGGYRAAFTHAEDYDLWLRIEKDHEIVNVPDLLGRYRFHENNTSHRNIRAQAVSVAAARGASRHEGPLDALASNGSLDAVALATLGVESADVAEAEVDIGTWWGEIATRAGARHARAARHAWKHALDAAQSTPDPSRSRERILRRRADVEAEQGRLMRARFTAAYARIMRTNAGLRRS
jgi:glycosyltransferase involved in cell wall biosynthesis